MSTPLTPKAIVEVARSYERLLSEHSRNAERDRAHFPKGTVERAVCEGEHNTMANLAAICDLVADLAMHVSTLTERKEEPAP